MIREAVSAAPPVLAAPDPIPVCRSNDPGPAKTVRYDLLMQQWQGEEWMRPDSPYQILPVTPKELQKGQGLFTPWNWLVRGNPVRPNQSGA